PVLPALREAWPMICRISLPVSLGYVVLFGNSTVFTRILATFSPTDVAGFGIAYRIQNLLLLPGIAIGVGLALTVNRMVAAERPEKVGGLATTVVLASFAFFALLAGLAYATRDLTTSVMTSNSLIAGAAEKYLTYLAPAYLLMGPLAAVFIFLEETGNGFRALRFNVCLVAAQLGVAFWLAQTHQPVRLIYLVLALSYLTALIFIGYELIRIHRLGGRVCNIRRA
ncbi:MAG: MATE family efflux transporter, partial [Streptosporangiaceae bacterium]